MLDLMPVKLIGLKDLNNWNEYSNHLNKLPFVKKYLGNSLEKWVKKIINPISIPWILRLYKDDLFSIDNNLSNMEKSIGKSNLSKLLHELIIQKDNPGGITTKIRSMNGEIFAYSELIKKYNKVARIEELGDWLCDDNTIISVKTKNELDYNYEIIENTLRSLYFMKENNVLKKYNYVDIKESKNIDDKFRNNVLWFLNSVLVEFINFQDKQINTWNNSKIETTKYFFDNANLQGILETKVEFFKDNNNKNNISLFLKEDRSGEQEELKHQVKFIFRDYPDKNSLSISFDTNTWWGDDNKIDLQGLKKSIDNYLTKFDKSYSNIKEQNKNFIGWININLHPKHENYSLETEKIKKDIKVLIGKKEYPIIIAFIPKLNSTKPNIIEI